VSIHKRDDGKPRYASKSATQADLDRIYGRGGLIIGAPVRPQPVDEPKPEPEEWSPERLAAFEADVTAFTEELLARRARDRQARSD